MKVSSVNIERVVPYARNPRKNTDAVAKVAGSIREFGFRQPIVVDDHMVVIAGHTRLLAARHLGLETVPVHVADGLTSTEVRAYRLADNRVSQESEWDEDLLKLEFGDLNDADFDLGLTGFDTSEITDLLVDELKEGLTDPDEIPEERDEVTTRAGDVWTLGDHRLVCGDCTDPAVWDQLKVGDNFVCFASPPYNVGKGAAIRQSKSRGPKKQSLYDEYSDAKSDDEYIGLLDGAMSAAFEHCDTVSFNLQPLANVKRVLLKWLDSHSTNLVDIVTWDKGNASPHIQRGIMSSRFEWIIIMSRKENATRVIPHSAWQGKYSNVYNAPPQKSNQFSKSHGATFPVHLPTFVMGDLMNRAEGIVDCFMGTGTSLIAAEMIGKPSCGIELTPAYCDMAVHRWENFTGKKAQRDGGTGNPAH